MKQPLKVSLALAITLTLTLAFALFHASAVQGKNDVTFDCYLIVDASETVPDVTFTYTIASGDAVSATTQSGGSIPATFDVSAGIGAPTITGSVSFSAADTDDALTTVASGDSITLKPGQKYVKKTVAVDFSGVDFDEVGIYRYVITESVDDSATSGGAVRYAFTDNDPSKAVVYKTYSTDVTTDDAVVHTVDADTQTKGTPRTRYMDVCVTQGASALETSYILHEQNALETVETVGAAVSDKSTGIVNSVSSHNLTFGKEVTGNQGSRNQYFKFTLTLGGSLTANEKYAVITPSEGNNSQNPTSITAEANGGAVAATANFYLKDGQYITVQGLPDEFTYDLTEDSDSYASTEGITAENNANNVAYEDPVSSTSPVTTSIRTGYTNSRNGTIPTGLLLTITPFVVGLFLFGALFFYMMARKRREY